MSTIYKYIIHKKKTCVCRRRRIKNRNDQLINNNDNKV